MVNQLRLLFVLLVTAFFSISCSTKSKPANTEYSINLSNIQAIIFGPEQRTEGRHIAISSDHITLSGFTHGVIVGEEDPYGFYPIAFLSTFEGNERKRNYQWGVLKEAQHEGLSQGGPMVFTEKGEIDVVNAMGAGFEDLSENSNIIFHIDNNGEAKRTTSFPGSLLRVNDMVVKKDGTLFLAAHGWTTADTNRNDYVVAAIRSPEGNMRYINFPYPSQLNAQMNVISCVLDKEDNLYFAGYTTGLIAVDSTNANKDCPKDNPWPDCNDPYFCKVKAPSYQDISCVQWGTSGIEFVFDMKKDDAENLWIVGSTSGILTGDKNYGGWDAFLTKITPKGEMTHWQWGGPSDDRAEAVLVDHLGNVVVIGNTDAEVDGVAKSGLGEELFITHFNPDGTRTTRVIGGQGNEYVYDAAINEKGVIVATGRTTSKAMTGKQSGIYGDVDHSRVFLLILTPDYKDPALNNNPLYDPDNIALPDEYLIPDDDSNSLKD